MNEMLYEPMPLNRIAKMVAILSAVAVVGLTTFASGQVLERFHFSDCMNDCLGDSTRIESIALVDDVTEIDLTAYANCNGNLEGHIIFTSDTLHLIYSQKFRREADEATGEVMDVIDIAMCNCVFKFNYAIKDLGTWDKRKITINGETLDEINRRLPVAEMVEIEFDADSTWLSDEVFTVVENPSQFPGGFEMFNQFIHNTLVYPKNARRKRITGRVFVQFVINKDGSIDDQSIKVLKGLNKSCNKEVIKLMKQCPDWLPATIKGQPVRQRTVMPITFNL